MKVFGPANGRRLVLEFTRIMRWFGLERKPIKIKEVRKLALFDYLNWTFLTQKKVLVGYGDCVEEL